MENNNIGNLMDITMSKMREMVDVDTVVGSPITTPDGITVIPVSRVSYAFASGGSDFHAKEKPGFGGGNGAGVKIEPIGFLVVKDGNVRMMSITPPAVNTVDRIIEKAPELIDTFEEFLSKQKKDK
ncbi:MAG: sporulation protein YtfJ [Ruminococcaceae bacterium]|nr:sporulation protein YtfJ [Oscillospiraceae bacterium]